MRGDFFAINYHLPCCDIHDMCTCMYTCINKMKITVKLQHINCCEQSEHIVHSTQFHLN